MMTEVLHLSDAKCVQRFEITSRSSSAEPFTLDATARQQLEKTYHENLENLFCDKNVLKISNASEGDKNVEEPDDGAFDFRLFSTKSALAPEDQNFQRIFLRSPTPTNQNPGFLVPKRPDAYYFTYPTSAEKIQQYQQAAVSGEEIIHGLKDIWPGFELPWRVTTFKLGESGRLSAPLPTEHETLGIKKRNGKKRRIGIRKRIAAKEAMERSKAEIEASTKEKRARKNIQKKGKKIAMKEAMGLSPGMSKAEEEAALKEKRTRRNREKKVKKKQREKLKKANAGDTLER